jgi:hypothetical protein
LAAINSEVQAHRSALAATKENNFPEQDKHHMHITTSTGLEVDDAEHTQDSELTTDCEHEVAILGYLMT